MPRLVSASSTHPRLRQVAISALFATLASSSASAFSNSLVFTNKAFVLSTNRGGGGSISHHTGKQQLPTTTATATRVLKMSSTTDAPTDSETSITTMTPLAKLEALRSVMKEYDLDVYLVPSDDPHLSGKMPTNDEPNPL